MRWADPVGEESAAGPSPPHRAGLLPSHPRSRHRGAPPADRRPACSTGRGGGALSDGDAVELVNDRGSVRFVLRVSDEAPLGVAYVSGQRPSGEAIAGTINMLCSDRYSDLGEGATYQDTRLDVRATAVGPAPAAR